MKGHADWVIYYVEGDEQGWYSQESHVVVSSIKDRNTIKGGDGYRMDLVVLPLTQFKDLMNSR